MADVVVWVATQNEGNGELSIAVFPAQYEAQAHLRDNFREYLTALLGDGSDDFDLDAALPLHRVVLAINDATGEDTVNIEPHRIQVEPPRSRIKVPERQALSLGILALNTLMNPDATSDNDFYAMDRLGERAVETLIHMRDEMDRQRDHAQGG
jgi:hypothetical protein